MTGCYHRTNPSTREERWGNVRTLHHENSRCRRESVRVGVDELVTRADAVSEQVAFVGQAGGLADECGLDAPGVDPPAPFAFTDEHRDALLIAFGQHDRVDLVVAVAGPPWPDGDHLGAERGRSEERRVGQEG